MKNTLENKARFFAQYWGQRILFDGNGHLYINKASNWRPIKSFSLDKLELKSLSDITDEDAIELGYDNAEGFIKNELRWNELHKIEVQDADYLRRRGYSVPYDGISEEQQIEYGWTRIIS